MNLIDELWEKSKELDEAIKRLAKNGKSLATAERDYKLTLRQEALKLRAEQDMPVTLINQIIYGVPNVAELRFKRDVAEALYTTNQEFINTTKLQIRILESQLNREWGSGGKV